MRMEVLAGPERRRRWSDEEKCRIVREAQEPGVRYADVARRHDISAAQLYQWRMALREGRLIDLCGGSNGFLEVAGDAVDFTAPVEAPVISDADRDRAARRAGAEGGVIADDRRTEAAHPGGGGRMITPGAGVRVHLACGVTDMRKGITGLAADCATCRLEILCWRDHSS